VSSASKNLAGPFSLKRRIESLARGLGVAPARVGDALWEAGLLPSQASISLPKKAPALYAERHKRPDIANLGIIDFLRAVWRPWIEARALTRVDLRRLDPSADRALQNFLRKSKLPGDLHIPKKSEILRAQLEHMPAEKIRAARRAINWNRRNAL